MNELAQRECFDLFRITGLRNFFRRGFFGDKWGRRYVFVDTLGHHICALIGHSKKRYIYDTLEGESWSNCLRCNRRVERIT